MNIINRKFTYIDLTYLNQMSNRNSEFIIEMIGIYKAQIPDFQNKLSYSRKKGDIEELLKITHKIKGALVIMGVSYFEQVLNSFEERELVEMTEMDDFIDEFDIICKKIEIELEGVENEFKNNVL